MTALIISIIIIMIILLSREYYNIITAEKHKQKIEESLIDLNNAKNKLNELDNEKDVLLLKDKIVDKEIELKKLSKKIGEKYDIK